MKKNYGTYYKSIMVLLLLIISTLSFAQTTQQELRNTYDHWTLAVSTAKGKPAQVLALYEPNAILVATFAPAPLTTRQEITDYFTKLTANKNMSIETLQFIPQFYGNIAIASGIYVFRFTDAANKKVAVKARYSFVYYNDHGHWLIVNHHSSQVPTAAH